MDAKITEYIRKGDIVWNLVPASSHHFTFIPYSDDDYHELTKWCKVNLKGTWQCHPGYLNDKLMTITALDDKDAMLIKLSF